MPGSGWLLQPLCFRAGSAIRGFHSKIVCAWRTLAPERGCVSSHIPLRGVRLLAELRALTGNAVSC